MFRLVLTHLLVLSLVVGPMLCCCAAARLGHEPTAAAESGGKRKHCCGEPASKDSERPAPGGKPAGPEKCPCKDSPRVDAAPETPVATADALVLVANGLPALDVPHTPGGAFATGRPAASFDHRSSALSADDILYAHHNLRC